MTSHKLRQVRPPRGEPATRADRGAERAAERRLLVAARAGDARALDQLVGLLAPPVFRYGRAFCRNRADAEDVMQETLAAVVRELGAFRGESLLSTWAFVVARNSCARLRRQRQREAQVAQTLALDTEAAGDSRAADPDRELDRSALGALLGRALRTLPRPWREAVLVRDVEGMSATEAARALGIGERALKSRLHRARAALRDAMRDAARRAPTPQPQQPARGRGCPDLALALSRYLEGEMTVAACAELEQHVSGCDSCGPACDELMASLARCRKARAAKPPLPVRRAVRAAIREALASHQRARLPRRDSGRAGSS
jgi:RNA polymerase sigma-70 factor (ECF subfamily)